MDTGWKYVTRQMLLILFIVLLCVVFLGLGLVIGYGFFGDGKHPFSILSLDKWQEIIAKFTGN